MVDKTELGGVPPEVASSSSSVVTAVDFMKKLKGSCGFLVIALVIQLLRDSTKNLPE